MKQVLPAHVREAERLQAVERARVNALCASITQQLAAAGWTDISVQSKATFIAIRGNDPTGVNHSGAMTDGQTLADFLIGIGVPPVPRKPAPEPKLVEEGPAEEPLPDPLARLVPDSIAETDHKEWLRQRHIELGHLVNGSSTFGAPSEAVIREHEQLERYRGFFS